MIPEIRNLGEQDFKFYWKPYLRGSPPFHFVFLAFEPPLPDSKNNDSPLEGIFSEPLQFVIRELLVSLGVKSGFLITNMAKCSLTVNDLCEKTRTARFDACFGFLQREVKLASKGVKTHLVSIGQKPKHYLDRRLTSEQQIHSITHYSKRNEWRFTKFAQDRQQEFNDFQSRIRPRYEGFLQRDLPGHLPWYEGGNGKNREKDLRRLFRWDAELEAIQKYLCCGPLT